jgi:excisionase family DNA binding protein
MIDDRRRSIPGKRLYSMREISTYVGISIQGLWRMLRDGEISAVQSQPGRKVWLDIQEIDSWIEKHRTFKGKPARKGTKR